MLNRRTALLGAAATGLILPAQASTVITRGTASAQAYGFARNATGGTPTQTVTWNATDYFGGVTVSGGGTTATTTGSGGGIRGTTSHSSGKYYLEIKVTPAGSINYSSFGLAPSTWSSGYIGNTSGKGILGYFGSWAFEPGGAGAGVTLATGNILGIAVDFGAGKMWFSKNGTWMASGNPSAGTNPALSSVSGTLFPACFSDTSGLVGVLTAGAFSYTPPTGFSAW